MRGAKQARCVRMRGVGGEIKRKGGDEREPAGEENKKEARKRRKENMHAVGRAAL